VGPALLAVQFIVLGAIPLLPHPRRAALPSPAHRAAHEQLLAYVKAQPGDVLIPGHGGITAAAGKAAGAHGQAIFDLFQVLPKAPDGSIDLLVLADPERLARLPGKANAALTAFRDGLLRALQQQRYSAIVLDRQIGKQFESLFMFGLLGPDGRADTADDLYRRRPGSLLRDGLALDPLIGFEVDDPYALEARR